MEHDDSMMDATERIEAMLSEVRGRLEGTPEADALTIDEGRGYGLDEDARYLMLGWVDMVWSVSDPDEGEVRVESLLMDDPRPDLRIEDADLDDMEDFTESVLALARTTMPWKGYLLDSLREAVWDWLESQADDFDDWGEWNPEDITNEYVAWRFSWGDVTVNACWADGVPSWDVVNAAHSEYYDGEITDLDDAVREVTEAMRVAAAQ